jgi:hypothetical protein
MLRMRLPVLDVQCGEGIVTDDQHMRCILLLRRFGEVKAPGNDRLPANDDLVMGYGMGRIDPRGHPLVREEIGGRILIRTVVLIEQHIDVHLTRVGVHEGFGHKHCGEARGLDQKSSLGGFFGRAGMPVMAARPMDLARARLLHEATRMILLRRSRR